MEKELIPVEVIAHYIGLSTIDYYNSKFLDTLVIAHYIGLSTIYS